MHESDISDCREIAWVLSGFGDLLDLARDDNFPRVVEGAGAIARVRSFHNLGRLDENLSLHQDFRRVLEEVTNGQKAANLDYEKFLVIASRIRDWLPDPNLLPKAWRSAAYDLRSAADDMSFTAASVIVPLVVV